VVAISVGALVAIRAQASPDPALPAVAPDRLVASVLQALAERGPISGKVDAFVDLGLPSLPDSGPASEIRSAAGLLSEISGSHHLRIWRSAGGLRVAEILPRSERALFVTPTQAWAWDFATFTAYRLPVDERDDRPDTSAPARMLDPLELARRALEAASPTTAVSVADTARVAGRAAYVLAVEPRSAATLVRRIEVDVDAEHRLPLRVAVFARGRTTASAWTAFTSVSFDAVDPSTYRFTPPPGAKVVDVGNQRGGEAHGEYAAPDGARVFGTGWDSIVALRLPRSETSEEGSGLDLSSFLPMSGPLLSIRLVERGDHAWLVYGLVPQSALAAVEPKLP
jgi:hypothetical protein